MDGGIGVFLSEPCDRSGDGNRGSKLSGGQQVSPELRGSDDFLWGDDNVTRIQLCGEHVPIQPMFRAATHHGAICPNNKDLFSVSGAVYTSCTTQVPAGRLARREGQSRRVVHLSGDQHESWPLWNRDHIAAA